MSYVRRLLENDREALLRVADDMRARGLDAREVTNAVGELDRVIGVVIEMSKPKAAEKGGAPKKRGRKPRAAATATSDEGEETTSDTIPPMAGNGHDEANGEGEEAVA